MQAFPLILLALGTIGHCILWVALVNRIHAVGIDRRLVDVLTLLCGMVFLCVPAAIVGVTFYQLSPPAWIRSITWVYVAVCAALCVGAAVQRWMWYSYDKRQGALLSNHTAIHDVAAESSEPLMAPGIFTVLGRVPGNQVLKLYVQEKEVAIPRLTAEHEKLRIAHITDLHMSGRIKRAYFERVVEEVNATDPDLIAITGDLVEWNSCLDWIPATFGRLRAGHGIYYVLGNHDRRVDQRRLKAALADAGLTYLGGVWQSVTVRDIPLILAGNELPWFPPAASFHDCPARNASGMPLRVVLAHSPDQFGWAQANGVDLILAGHLHGGQVSFPLLGPITSPSRHGVRYVAGTFRVGSTVLHVSRGVSSLTPIRWNCPPEISVLNLCPAAAI